MSNESMAIKYHMSSTLKLPEAHLEQEVAYGVPTGTAGLSGESALVAERLAAGTASCQMAELAAAGSPLAPDRHRVGCCESGSPSLQLA